MAYITPPVAEPALSQPYPGAPVQSAVIRFWKKGFTFTGRASMAEFWKAYLVAAIPAAALYLVAATADAANAEALGDTVLTLFSLYVLVCAVPMIAASVRRLHDIGQTGALCWLYLVPFVGGVIVLIFLAQRPVHAGARFDLPADHAHVPDAPQRTALPPTASRGSVPPPPPPPPPPPDSSRPSRPSPAPADVISDVHGGSGPMNPAVVSSPSPAILTDSDDTRRSSLLAAASWVAGLPDGRRIPISGEVYFGRAPVAAPEHRHAVLVPIDDGTRSMSKTHAMLVVDGQILRLTDLHSSNGSMIMSTGGTATSLVPGTPTAIYGDCTVTFGDCAVDIREHRHDRL